MCFTSRSSHATRPWRVVFLPLLVLSLISLNARTEVAPWQWWKLGPRSWGAGNLVRIRWAGQAPIPKLPDEKLQQLIQKAFDAWIVVIGPDDLKVDVGARIQSKVSSYDAFQALLNKAEADVIVVFDDSGDTLRELGKGQPIKDWSAFTTERPRPGQDIGAYLTRMVTVVDSRKEMESSVLFRVLLHETGHALGLDNSPVNWDVGSDLPMMTPYGFGAELRSDDNGWISELYKRDSLDYQKANGWMVGYVVDSRDNRTRLPWIHVVAIPTADAEQQNPNLLPRESRISCVTALGEDDNLGRGGFRIPVPLGTYRLLAESIPVDFPPFAIEIGSNGRVRSDIQIEQFLGPLVHVDPGKPTETQRLPVRVVRR